MVILDALAMILFGKRYIETIELILLFLEYALRFYLFLFICLSMDPPIFFNALNALQMDAARECGPGLFRRMQMSLQQTPNLIMLTSLQISILSLGAF